MSLYMSQCRSHAGKVTHLVDVVTWYGVVKRTVEIIQQFDDLYRSTFRRQHRESDNIREVDRRTGIDLWSNTASSFQFIRHVTVEQCIAQDNAEVSNLLTGLYLWKLDAQLSLSFPLFFPPPCLISLLPLFLFSLPLFFVLSHCLNCRTTLCQKITNPMRDYAFKSLSLNRIEYIINLFGLPCIGDKDKYNRL